MTTFLKAILGCLIAAALLSLMGCHDGDYREQLAQRGVEAFNFEGHHFICTKATVQGTSCVICVHFAANNMVMDCLDSEIQ